MTTDRRGMDFGLLKMKMKDQELDGSVGSVLRARTESVPSENEYSFLS